jgi:hypothetical protein
VSVSRLIQASGFAIQSNMSAENSHPRCGVK